MYTLTLDITIIFIIIGFILLNAISYYAMRYTLFPNVIWVLGFGMLYGALNYFDIINLPILELDPHLIFFVLVPILIFATAKNMCLHHFRQVRNL